MTKAQKREEVRAIIAKEKAVLDRCTKREKKVNKLMALLNTERRTVELEKSIYLAAREQVERDQTSGELLGKTREKAGEKADKAKMDFLAPFLPPTAAHRDLTLSEALDVKARCLLSLKERLCERALIMEAHLADEEEKRDQKALNFERGIDTPADWMKYNEQAEFRIKVLNMRLKQHEINAMIKYRDTEEKLMRDDRLLALRSQAAAAFVKSRT